MFRGAGLVRKAVRKVNFKLADIDAKMKIGKKVKMSLSDMYFMQFDKHELKRYDMIVRYLAIEEYYGKNTCGFELYRKMQNARIHDGYSQSAVQKFRRLIDSYERNGYSQSSYVIADKNLSLFDGSHRMAMNMYHGISSINVLIVPTYCEVDYSIDWFFQNGFTDDEIDIILSKAKELTKRLNRPFSCVIWSPAASFTDKIIKDLSYFGTVCGYKRYDYREAEYANIVKAIYAIDDIADWKIDKKIEHMRQYPPSLVAVDLKFDFPDFRIKSATNMPLSKIGERVKRSLRAKYKEYIDNYYFDIIMHIADNYLQSEYMHRVFEPNIDFTEALNILNNFKYALMKLDVPYMPKDFPHSIPIGKDIDIICLKKDFEYILDKLVEISGKQKNYDIRIKRSSKGAQIRYELCGNLIFLFDIAYSFDNLKNEYINDLLDSRIKEKSFYTAERKYEFIYRAVSYMKNKTKTHHLDYLKKHKEDLDASMLEKYSDIKSEEIRKIIWE